MNQLLVQLLLGSGMIVLATAVQTLFVATAFRVRPHISRRIHHLRIWPLVLVISVGALWMLAGQTVGVWLWALCMIQVGAFATLEPALYFALSAYTTIGFGDVLPPAEWRILGALIGANGMIGFGLAAAALVDLVLRLHRDLDRP